MTNFISASAVSLKRRTTDSTNPALALKTGVLKNNSLLLVRSRCSQLGFNPEIWTKTYSFCLLESRSPLRAITQGTVNQRVNRSKLSRRVGYSIPPT